jgi:hypothetical protein
MRWRIGFDFAYRSIARISGWMVGSPPLICARSRLGLPKAQGSGNRAQRQRNEIAGIVGEGKVFRLRQPTRAADAPCDQRRGEPGKQIEK